MTGERWAVAPQWTKERVETLRKLAAEGHSAKDMAALLGSVTRNALIGKIKREGIVWASAYLQARSIPKAKPATRRLSRASSWVTIFPQIAPSCATELPSDKPDNPCSLLELNKDTCRWPCEGVGAATTFCGGEPAVSRSYCARHCRMAYQKMPSERQRSIARSRYLQRSNSIVTPHAPPLAPEDFAA